MKKKLSIGLLTLFAITPLWAEEVDEIVVSATGIPTPISQIGASVDVITAEDLERQQITYLQDALATVAGVSTYQSGGPGSTSNVFMRGMTGKYSGVYIDGVQINDPASQQAAWGLICRRMVWKAWKCCVARKAFYMEARRLAEQSVCSPLMVARQPTKQWPKAAHLARKAFPFPK